MTIGIGPFQSIHDTMAFATKDWAEDKNDAWICGIVCGWDDDAYAELARKFRWPESVVARNRALHLEWLKAENTYASNRSSEGE